MMRRRGAAVLVVALLVVAACSGSEGSTPAGETTTSQITTPTTSAAAPTEETVTTPSTDPGQDENVNPSTSVESSPTTGTLPERAIADLAARLDIDPREIRLVSFEEMTWPDGSIGCPQPGMRYTQAIVNGSKVVLEANDILYNYHIGGNRDLFLCEQPTAIDKTPPPSLEI